MIQKVLPMKTDRKTPAEKRFFTLVEMIAAMAVMIFVALIIGTASMSFYNTWARAGRVTSFLKSAQAIDRIADNYFRNMIPFKWKDEEDNNKQKFVFEGKSDSMLFTALRRSHAGDKGGIIFIKLYVENEELIAEYTPYPFLPWEEEGTFQTTKEVLCNNVESVSFLYAEKNEEQDEGMEFLEEWDEEEHEAIPLAVQMTVTWKNGRKEQWFRRAAGTSKYSTLGYRRTPSL